MRTQSEINSTEWFGSLPSGWKLRPMKSLFQFSKGLSITKADLTENGTPVISYGQIHSKDCDGTSISDSLIRYVPTILAEKNESSRIACGGFVFADTSEDLAGVGNCAYNEGNKNLFGGYHTVIANPLFSSHNKYFAYLFRTDAWRKQLRAQLVDVKVFSVTQGILAETYVAAPPLDVQRSIVAFLDSHCKPIDEAVARHRLIIDKLEDYRMAVIIKTVTKGLDDSVPMKDSGIEWIGQIPESWHTPRIKFIAKLASGGTPSREHSEYWGGTIPWVKTGELNDSYIENIEETITEEGLKNSSAKVFPKDTLLMAMYGQTRGTTGCLTKESAINQACVAFTNLHGVSKEYLWMALRAIYNPIRKAAVGSGQPNLSSSLIADFPIPIPSYTEQVDIAKYLNYKCAAIDEGVNRQKQVISKLEEYRRSLIFHAVTGRIDCTGGAC